MQVLHIAASRGVPAAVIGKVQESELTVRVNGKEVIRSEVERLSKIWKDAIPCLLGK
jgi:phosphoribosylformylglycinamidine synthase